MNARTKGHSLKLYEKKFTINSYLQKYFSNRIIISGINYPQYVIGADNGQLIII